jgi:hypothetical protein
MKTSIALLAGLILAAGAGVVQAAGGHGGGGHGGGGHGGGHAGGITGAHPGASGGFTHFTTGTMHFTTGPHPVHPIAGVRPGPVFVGRPGFPHHRVIVGGAVVVAAPFFWYPPYPYPYYPYGYVSPAYGGPAYEETPTYVEQGSIAYYCPDYQDYYPNVPTCPSPWMQVVPEPGAPQ